MRLKSRGLGRKELVMDFREYEVVRENDEIVIKGMVNEPVHWDFSIRVCEDDLAGIARVASKRATIALILRCLFKRNKRHHWSTDRATHLAMVRQRRQTNDSAPMDAPLNLEGGETARSRGLRAARQAAAEARSAARPGPESDRTDPARQRATAVAETAGGPGVEAAAMSGSTATSEERTGFGNLRPVVNRANVTRRGLVLAGNGGTGEDGQSPPEGGTAVGL